MPLVTKIVIENGLRKLQERGVWLVLRNLPNLLDLSLSRKRSTKISDGCLLPWHNASAHFLISLASHYVLPESNLEQASVGDIQVSRIAKSLTQLVRLDLCTVFTNEDFNDVGEQGCKELAKGLPRLSWLSVSTLVADAACNKIGDEGCYWLSRGPTKLIHLEMGSQVSIQRTVMCIRKVCSASLAI